MQTSVFLSMIMVSFVLGCQKSEVKTVFPESQSGLSASCAESVIPNEFLVRYSNGVTQLIHASNTEHFIESYLKPNIDVIEYAEFHKVIKIDSTLNTSQIPQEATPSHSWGQDIIQAHYAHSLGFTGDQIKVAVLDTPIDVTHSALANQIAINTAEQDGVAGVDDDGNGLIDDIYGWDFYRNEKIDFDSEFHEHGTHVAGIIAGNTNDWNGVAPSSKIIPISFMGNNGYGNISSALSGLRYAKARGAQIINASWGGPLCSKLLEDEIKNVIDSGILFVAASGNNGVDLDLQPQYPAAFNFPLQITVAATRPSDYLAGFSNTSFRLVHIAAPGDGIWSTLPNNQYGFLTGTSMAAPFVSGAAAVLMSARPDLPPTQIRQAILSGVDAKTYRVQTSGRLNLKKSLDLILSR